jgi:hypothetical protein
MRDNQVNEVNDYGLGSEAEDRGTQLYHTHNIETSNVIVIMIVF